MPRMTTVVRPGVYPPGHQFTAQDYVLVPVIDIAGTFTVWQSARFTADPRIQSELAAQRAVKLLTDAYARYETRKDARK